MVSVIDLKFLRENPDVARASQQARGEDPALVDQLGQLREVLHAVEGVSDSDAVRDLLTRVNMLEEQVEDGDGKIPASLLERFLNKAVETLADESAQRIIPVLSTIYVLLGLPPLTA